MSRWRLEATEVEPGIWDCLAWRQERTATSEVFCGRGMSSTRLQAAQRARRSTKHRYAYEPWCRDFAEKCLQEALAKNGRRSWSNL